MGSLKTHIGAPFSIVSQGIRPESKREFSERQGGKSNCVSRSLPPCPKTCCQLSGDIYRLTRETRAVRGTPTKKPGLTKHKAITALFQRQNWGRARCSVSLRSSQVLLQLLAHSHLRRSKTQQSLQSKDCQRWKGF